MSDASNALMTAIVSSLGNSAHQWSVVSALETYAEAKETYTTSYEGGGSSSSILTHKQVTTNVVLQSGALRSSVGSATPMVLTYSITTNDGVLISAGITVDGCYLHADANTTLRDAVMGLRNSFNTAMDASLIAAIAAGAQPLPNAIPSELLSALKTSLASTTADWTVRAAIETPIGTALRQVSVSIGSMVVGMKPTLNSDPDITVPAQFVYAATINGVGNLVEAKIIINGAMWSTNDANLHSVVMGMVVTYKSGQNTGLLAALS